MSETPHETAASQGDVRRALRALTAQAGERVAVVVPDATRPLPVTGTIGPLLERLDGAQVTLLVGLGLHRPMTDAELHPLRALADRHGAALVQHDASDPEVLVTLDADAAPEREDMTLPVVLHRALLQQDRVICVGTVEPHQYAGFSGGAKAVAIGCAGHATISAMHGLALLRDPHTAVGVLQNNPFQELLWRIVAPLERHLGRPLDALQRIPATPHVCVGPARAAFARACAASRAHHFLSMTEAVDWMHLRVPEVKAQSFYQASRAATYAALVDRCAVREGGWLLLEASCPEGIGEGRGERACAALMSQGDDPLRHLQKILDGAVDAPPPGGGQQRALVIARAMRRCRIALIGAPHIPELAGLDIPQFDSINAARRALALGPRGVVIDDPFHQVPTLAL